MYWVSSVAIYEHFMIFMISSEFILKLILLKYPIDKYSVLELLLAISRFCHCKQIIILVSKLFHED